MSSRNYLSGGDYLMLAFDYELRRRGYVRTLIIRTHHAAGEKRTRCANEYCATHYFHLAVPVIDRYRFAVAERGTLPATSLFCPSIVR